MLTVELSGGENMKHYDVTGMTCAACSSRVEKAVSGVDGVISCSVNLLTNSMTVEGDMSSDDVITAVERVGYGASEKGKNPSSVNNDARASEGTQKKEENALASRLLISLAALLVLMYFSMGHNMLSLPVPSFLDNNPVGLGLLQMLLCIVVMLINKRFFVNGIKGVLHGAANMDTLVAMGSGVSFAYSTAVLFSMTYHISVGQIAEAAELLHGLYFESSAMILTLITVGKFLEARSKGKTTDAIKGLMRLTPDTAVVEINGEEKTVRVSDISVGDVFVVRAGDSIPVDGEVINGSCTVNESALTGESVPCEKEEGSKVSAGTVSTSGFVKCRATGVGNDTLLAGIIRTVSEASATKAPVAKTADKVAGVFVPAVILIAFLTVIIWLIIGKDFGYSLARGISVLVISCPCALGLATPVAIMVGSGMGAKNGVLFKNAKSLELAGKISIVALDKTGTITKGRPVVTDIIPLGGISEDELLKIAYSVESKSEHPLARAICEMAVERNIVAYEVTDFATFPGNGVFAVSEGKRILAGNKRFISEKNSVTDKKTELTAEMLSADGKTPMFFAYDNFLAGIIAVADEIKPDSAEAVRQLKNMGIYTVMLTGDNKRTAEAIGRQADVDRIYSDVLPEGKHKIIEALQKYGLTAMVGDGINDAPALTKADVGIAIGAGTDIAIDSADVVLIKGSLIDAVKAVRLGRLVLKNIKQNLFWAFGYNIVGIPLAAGVFTALLGWSLNPAFGAAAMSLSSFLVVSNALRLNLFDLKNASKDRKINNTVVIKEEKTMTKTMKIEGMMCMHCEARVKKTLEAIDGVALAEVSHEKGTAVLTLKKAVDNKVLTEAIEAQDYKVLSIE